MPEIVMTSAQIAFLAMAAAAILAALGVVLSKDPLRSLICLVLNLFVIAFIYFSLGASLLGITQIIVYVGAIMVLFLFVVMLLNLVVPEKHGRGYALKLVGLGGLGVALIVLLFSQVIMPAAGMHPAKIDPSFGSPQSIGKVLFTQYVWPFEMVGVLLLVGVVGSILLAKRRF